MEFVKVEMSLPPIFAELEKKMKALRKKLQVTEHGYTIAGGSLCNLYLGRRFRDIDIFADFSIDEESLLNVFGEGAEIEYKQEFGSYGDSWEVPYLYRLSYEGYTVEIIASSKHRIFDFDLRFRYFFLQDGIVYAAQDALDDLKREQLVIVSPKSPLSTLFRTFRFQREFGFSIDETSFSYLTWHLNSMVIDQEYVYSFLEKQTQKVGKEVVDAFKEYLEPYWSYQPSCPTALHFPDASFPFHESLENMVAYNLREMDHPFFGLYYEPLKAYTPQTHRVALSLDARYWDGYWEKLQEELKIAQMKNWFSATPLYVPTLDTWRDLEENIDSIQNLLYTHNHAWQVEDIINRVIRWEEHDTELTAEISPAMIDYTTFPLGDLVEQYVWVMNVGSMRYYMRKTENGKLTLSGIDGCGSNGSFYLQAVGHALVKANPDLFEFGNRDVRACFSYSPYSSTGDYFFSAACRDHEHPFVRLSTNQTHPLSHV